MVYSGSHIFGFVKGILSTKKGGTRMKILLILISCIGLAMSILPSVLVFLGKMDMQTNTTLMTIGMVLWFGTSPFWINSKTDKDNAADN
jgi:hypothetical protein